MTNITNELMYEVLKQIQADLRKLDAKTDEIKTEIQAVRTHVLGLQQDTGNIYAVLSRHDDRLDRIAHRLELADAPAPSL